MRRTIRPYITGLFALVCGSVVGLAGCAQIPPCTVSPIEIEETREDVKVIENDLVDARTRSKKLSDELAAKQTELEGKKDKPKVLKKRLKELKKGSGRDDEKKDDEKETA